MLVAEDGISMLVKEEHSQNASSPMLVTEDEISMLVKEEQQLNA